MGQEARSGPSRQTWEMGSGHSAVHMQVHSTWYQGILFFNPSGFTKDTSVVVPRRYRESVTGLSKAVLAYSVSLGVLGAVGVLELPLPLGEVPLLVPPLLYRYV